MTHAPNSQTASPSETLMRWLNPTSIILTLILSVALPIVSGVAAVQFSAGSTSERLTTVEKTVETNKADRKSAVEELKNSVVSRDVFDAELKAQRERDERNFHFLKDELLYLRQKVDKLSENSTKEK